MAGIETAYVDARRHMHNQMLRINKHESSKSYVAGAGQVDIQGLAGDCRFILGVHSQPARLHVKDTASRPLQLLARGWVTGRGGTRGSGIGGRC